MFGSPTIGFSQQVHTETGEGHRGLLRSLADSVLFQSLVCLSGSHLSMVQCVSFCVRATITNLVLFYLKAFLLICVTQPVVQLSSFMRSEGEKKWHVSVYISIATCITQRMFLVCRFCARLLLLISCSSSFN